MSLKSCRKSSLESTRAPVATNGKITSAKTAFVIWLLAPDLVRCNSPNNLADSMFRIFCLDPRFRLLLFVENNLER